MMVLNLHNSTWVKFMKRSQDISDLYVKQERPMSLNKNGIDQTQILHFTFQ